MYNLDNLDFVSMTLRNYLVFEKMFSSSLSNYSSPNNTNGNSCRGGGGLAASEIWAEGGKSGHLLGCVDFFLE